MNKVIIVLSFFLLCLVFVSCSRKDDEPGELPFHEISPSLHPFLFSEESIWIYTDAVNNVLDTLVLVEFENSQFSLGPSGPGQGPSGNAQFFKLSYESSFSQDYDEQLVGYLISRGYISGGYTYLSSYYIGDENKNALLVDIIDTLEVGDLMFNNVVKMNVNADNYVNNDMNLYYVDSIGVVRKEIKENDIIIETWDLIEYEVNLFQVE